MHSRLPTGGRRPGRRAAVGLVLAATIGAGTALSQPQAQSPQTDAPVFLDSLGVNVHFNYKDTLYANLDASIRALKYLGVTHIRQDFPSEWSPGGMEPEDLVGLARAGMRFDFVVDAEGSFDPARLRSRADALEQTAPCSFDAIEGFNEINNWPVTYRGEKSVPAAEAGMHALYAALRQDPRLAGVQIYDMTGDPTDPVSLAGRADALNVHPYPQNGEAPALAKLPILQRRDYPRVATETGNFSLPASWPKDKPWWEGYTMLGIDETSQAKSVLLAYFEAAELGVSRTYIYELLDEKPDPQDDQPQFHYGLFRTDYSPKPAATAIHNLTTLLGSDARPAPAQAAPATIPDPPPGLHQLAIRKNSQTWALALWHDAAYWRWVEPKAFPVQPPPIQVRLHLDGAPRSLALADPLTGARTPLPVAADPIVDVPEYPVLIMVER